MKLNKYLSVVVCVYNEADNVKPLVQQITGALSGLDYELIYVDDGSTDGTLQELKNLHHPALRIIELSKNYGQSSALAAGIEYARGKFIITMDGDLQNDPSNIPSMVQLAEDGDWDLVAGIRVKRKDGMLLRKIPSKIANFFIRTLSGVKMKDYGCTLKVFRRDIAKSLGLYGELHRFIPVMASLEGARITQVPVKHHPRIHGKSKYGIGRTVKVISDLILILFMKRYLQRPMHLFGNLGVALFGLGAVINLYLLILKILGHDIWGKPLLILGVLLVIAGIQFVTIGLVTEIQIRTYYESQEKKPYRIRQIIEEEISVVKDTG